MASTHHSPYDFRLILPLPGGATISSLGKDLSAASPWPAAEETNRRQRDETPIDLAEIRAWKVVGPQASAAAPNALWERASKQISDLAEELRALIAKGIVLKGNARVLSDNLSLLRAALTESKAGIETASRLPWVQTDERGRPVPRAFPLAAACLRSMRNLFDGKACAAFLASAQEAVALRMAEIWSLKPFLELVLLDQIADFASGAVRPYTRHIAGDSAPDADLSALMHSLREISDLEWKAFFEQASTVEQVLRTDPQGTYAKMDFASRESCRAVVADLASHSRWTEEDVARKAIALAGASEQTPRASERLSDSRSHVGYYLIGAGLGVLRKAINYRPPVSHRIRRAILKHSDYFYLVGIELATLAALVFLVVASHAKPPAILALTLFLLPAVECAVAVMNLIATRLFPPQRLARLDFSKAIPDDCSTVVAIPTLLTSEDQLRAVVRGLEVRFLGNRDPHLHFALLTDPPDSAVEFDEKDQLVGVCSALIDELNRKYDNDGQGRFYHFHRNRVYNSSENLWMGWERKRGKLLDFNRFLLGQADAFASKTGDLSRLQNIRYVITLDVDTQLPPETAHKLVGTLAHPLNRAVIDPRTGTVVEGYGILQPRVDISVRSASRSRLASLLSGDTGIDLYTRAVSDVYQDLFGEAIFTGKGIYEVAAFQKVLEHRFPCNAVLSHDLIEGVYARTGLVSDVEVVDDYPSHFSAFSRRKHRWVRGDWQIIFGLLPRMRDSFGRTVRNPLSHISRWKIVDNLRRSLMECATLLLLLYCWTCLPGRALYATLAVLALLFLPTCFQALLSVLTAKDALFTIHFWKNLGADFLGAFSRMMFRLTFLCHQSLVATDAVVRTLVRMKLTRRNLLQWETAADAEAGALNSPVDTYLKWTPALSLAIGALIFAIRPSSLPVALPFLVLWSSSIWICKWLNRPQSRGKSRTIRGERALLRDAALRTWRFFREFSTREENWLIPDIVQQQPPLVAHRTSTTNLGLLLNSRLAARDLGFLTLPEFIEHTGKTLETVASMPKYKGHLYNWYVNDTLEPVEPRFVSTVDNGNLVCSLWTLKQGCLESLAQPLFQPALWHGIGDIADLLADLAVASSDQELIPAANDLRQRVRELAGPGCDRFDNVRALEIDVAIFLASLEKYDAGADVEWWARELSARVSAFKSMIEDFAPWLAAESLLPVALPQLGQPEYWASLTLESAPRIYESILAKLRQLAPQHRLAGQAARLSDELERSVGVVRDTAARLAALAASIQSMVDAMEFGFLYDSGKKLISIGFDATEGSVSTYHYDLLASEARAAVFAAIAKGEIPQESWFELDRSFVTYKGQDVLRSWTGTAFEYLMPNLWFRTYPNTLLDRCSRSAVRAHQEFVAAHGKIPWGISESSCNQRNPDGHYRYHAFGVPPLAMNRDDCSGDLVIAPYATFLALPFDPAGSLENLRKMKDLGWLSHYGFFEAADFTPRRVGEGKTHEVVRNWMAHHQGMTLASLANVLCDSSMQRRFHAEPCVAAHERLLHEKYPRVLPKVKDQVAGPESLAAGLIDFVKRFHLHSEFRDPAPKLQ